MAPRKPPEVAASPYLSAKWSEITRGRTFERSDVPALTMLCKWHEVYDKCLEDIGYGGELQLAYSDEQGNLKPLPQLATMKQASAEIRALGKQLGIGVAREEKPKKKGAAKVKVTAFERIASQRAQGPARKPGATVPRSA